MPSSADIHKHVISLSWPVKIAAGDGLISENKLELIDLFFYEINLTLIWMFFINNCSFCSIPYPNTNSRISWTRCNETISCNGDVRTTYTCNHIKMSIEYLTRFCHIGTLYTKTFIPITRRNNKTIVGSNNKTLMTLLNTLIKRIAKMTTM